MPAEPKTKRTHAFIDGQNLFYAAKKAFGYTTPNYEPLALAKAVSSAAGWQLEQVHFYTGIPNTGDPAVSHKLAMMGKRGIRTFARPLCYRNQTVSLPGGRATTVLVGQEKGVDVRIALDIVRYARQDAFDVALVFSQDQDLSEVADEVRAIAREQGRWIKIASAFPCSPNCNNQRGVNGTDWLRIDRETYDACIDPTDYSQLAAAERCDRPVGARG